MIAAVFKSVEHSYFYHLL